MISTPLDKDALLVKVARLSINALHTKPHTKFTSAKVAPTINDPEPRYLKLTWHDTGNGLPTPVKVQPVEELLDTFDNKISSPSVSKWVFTWAQSNNL